MAQEVKKLEGSAITSGAPAERKTSEAERFRDMIGTQKGAISKVLPSHIPFDKFQSVIMTAVLTSPDLLTANRHSLIMACIKSATDGLLPDGREAALVIFNSRVPKSEPARYELRVQYLPMYQGILKKVRQSGQVAAIRAQVVFEKDKFEYFLGDNERVEHEPFMDGDRGKVRAAYAIAKLKDGEIVREVMSFSDIEKIRKSSKAGAEKDGSPKGIWKSWYEEMARKTVFRRLSKWLPQSVDLNDMIRPDRGLVDAFDIPAEEVETGEVIEHDENGVIENGDQGAITDQSGQPDLKEEIAKANAKEKVSVSTPAKAAKPAKAKADKPPAETPDSDFERIRNDMVSSPDIESLNAVWSGGGEDAAGANAEALKKMGPGEWNKLRALYDELSAKMAGGK